LRIAIDAMGGDMGPRGVVEGAIRAARQYNYNLQLVGNARNINRLLKAGGMGNNPLIEVIEATDTVDMCESPKQSLKKKDSSIAVSTRLAKEGRTDAVISAGNTGAVMASALFSWRTLPGISRPAIATLLPSLKHPVVLIDSGANADCKPLNLLQFAVMGHCYAHYVLGRTKPRIGLLSIGEEASKGNELTVAAHKLIAASHLNFRGNAEGRDIMSGKFDVIVCDGFVGNIVLKFAEGVAKNIMKSLKGEIKKGFITRLAAIGMKPAFKSFKKRVDSSELGGAPLLGLNGNCIICHGLAGPRAFMNAVRVAGEIVNHNVNKHIIIEMEKLKGKE
jgi:phosphate acyltransferase